MTTRHLAILVFVLFTQDNHAPVVKIQIPAANTTMAAAASARYEIAVIDKEDGDSRYDEINPKEVLLEMRAGVPPKTDPLEAPGLAVMARSNCFNCHQFDGKLIGPSLADIAKRYPVTAAITDTLTRRIKDGSAGIWGKEKMPSHPEVNSEDIRRMVQWIQKYGTVPGVTFRNGTSGVLQIAKPGVYTLTAVYTDHGVPYLTGTDRITLTVK